MLAHDALFTTPTCRAFALEQNHRLFHQANALSQCALDLLDAPTLDAEAFAHYQALRRKADLKFAEAIDHLRLIQQPPRMRAVQLRQRSAVAQEA